MTTSSKLEAAVAVIQSETELGACTYFSDPANWTTCPACGIGALTRALPPEHESLIVGLLPVASGVYVCQVYDVVATVYGIPRDRINDLIEVNDGTEPENRKAAVITFLRGLETEEVSK